MNKIKGWKRFQHYKGRRPPWIKLHRTLLDDREFDALDGEAAKALIKMWLIASEYDGGLPRHDDLAFRLRISPSKLASVIRKLNHWLEHDASTMLADCKQLVPPETETETETETELERGPPAPVVPFNVNWQPSWAANGLTEAEKQQLPAFRDYVLAHGKRYRNHDAAFRNWMRKHEEFRAARPAWNGGKLPTRNDGGAPRTFSDEHPWIKPAMAGMDRRRPDP